jgi:hypothetical protein
VGFYYSKLWSETKKCCIVKFPVKTQCPGLFCKEVKNTVKLPINGLTEEF